MTPVRGAEPPCRASTVHVSSSDAPAARSSDPTRLAHDFDDDGPANRARGEVVLAIDGVPRRLCLTLGALAELESAFRATGLKALATRLAQASAQDLLVVLDVLARAGGAAMTPGDLARATLDPTRAALAVAAVFTRACGDGETRT